jgi:GT2 family glycosyltransferase
VRATIIVPFHRNRVHLHACLAALRRSAPELELIVAADGVVEDCGGLADVYSARVISVAGPSGPAVARNRAATHAHGDILLFVDADVVACRGAIIGMCECLEANPEIVGVFGAYNRTPVAANFVSQFKNLSHAYVHEVGNRDASTFWAGLGAVRASAFHRVGGFDERFARPSVEDIDLGYRLAAAGGRLRLDPTFRGVHLKRWTLRSCIVTDVVARGIPWTQLILRFKALSNDLNLSLVLRSSVVLAYAFVVALVLTGVTAWAAAVAIAMLAALVAVNRDYYRWFARQRGPWFALRVIPMHLLHHLCNGVSCVIGTAVFVAQRAGIELPGALPFPPWSDDAPANDEPLRSNPSR